MDDRQWEKLGALGGIVFVVLNVIGGGAQGEPPSSGDTNDEVRQWFVDNASGIKLSGFLGALSGIAILWWFGTLWRRMSAAENGRNRLAIVAAIGLAMTGAFVGVSGAVNTAVVFRVDEVTGDTARLFYTLNALLFAGAGTTLAAHLAAVNALSWRTGMLPKWVTTVGLAAAVLNLVSSFGLLSDADGLMFFGLIGFLAWALWLIATSVHMWRTPSPTA